LITAGSTEKAMLEQPTADKSLQFLPKPYQVSDLVKVVGAMLKSNTFSIEREALLAEARVAGPGSRRDRGDTNGFPNQRASSHRRSAIRLGVRPFGTAGSADENAFSMGLAEEITRAFAPFSWITCVSPASITDVANRSGDKVPGWAELDLDFLLEGNLRRKGDGIRIGARLMNMSGGSAMVWERGFDGSMPNVLRLQDQIAAETAAQVAPEVLVWKGQEAAARPQVDPTAYELMLRAIPAIYRLDEPAFRGAGALLERALDMDPSNAACHSWLAHWYLFLIGQGWNTDIGDSVQRANELAQRAVLLDPTDARGFAVAGHVRAFLRKEAPEALSLHESAIRLNPNFALAWCYSGLAHSYLGRHAEAIHRIERAQQLSPYDPHGFFFAMAMVMPLLLTGKYEAAARVGRRAQEEHPGLSSTYKGLLAVLGHLREKRESAKLRKRLLQLEPHFSIDEAISRSPLLLPADRKCYVDGLRLAGIPERSRQAARQAAALA
jgi:TolB-like protein